MRCFFIRSPSKNKGGIDGDNGEVIRQALLDGSADDTPELLGCLSDAGIHNDVEDEVGVARPHDNTEIVDAAQTLDIAERFFESGALGTNLLTVTPGQTTTLAPNQQSWPMTTGLA